MPVLISEDDHYEKIRNKGSQLIDEYNENMVSYMQQRYPDTPIKDIRLAVKTIIAKKYDPPKVKYLYSKSKGNIEIKEGTLLEYDKLATKYIRTAYGSTFVPPTERVSMFRDIILGKQAARAEVKHDEILAESKGDYELAMIKKLVQLKIKLSINIYSGVMLSNVAFRSSIHYNAITSVARFATMTGYAYTERMVADNFYFASEDHAINWVVNLLRENKSDQQVKLTTSTYKLKDISYEFLMEKMRASVNAYSRFSKNLQLKELLGSLNQEQRNFIYYAGSLNRIMFTNPDTKDIFTDFINTVDIPDYTGPIKSVFELKDDTISTYVYIIMSDELKTKDGKNITVDIIDKEYPELGKKIISLYHATEKKLGALGLMFSSFINLSVLPGNSIGHKHMLRKTVIMSDTDSIILTLIAWAKWYTGSTKLTKESFHIASVVVMILSKGFAHIFTLLCVRMGVPKADMRRLIMENEYMYSALLRTVIAKHYAGYVDIREGQILSPPKFDLKGKNFVGSTLCEETLTEIETIVRHILDIAVTGKELSFDDLIRKVITFEQTILVSISQGKTNYLETMPIKMKRDYKTPYSSSYIFFELWEFTFAKKYGPINVPQKCRVVPIKKIKAKTYERYITDPDTLKGFKKFFDKFPKKELTRVFIPIGNEIPIEIKPIINNDKVVEFNSFPLKLIMKSFNILTTSTFTNNYPELAEEIRKQVHR